MNKHPTTQFVILCGIFIGFLFILACGTTEIATPVLPSSTVCPTVYWTPATKNKPLFIFILIDGTHAFFEQNGIEDTKAVLANSLTQVVHTGDRIVLGWIRDDTEYSGIEGTIFYDRVFIVQAKDIKATPTIPPSPAPLNNNYSDSATPSPTPSGQLKQTEVARTVDAARNIEEQSIQRYFCQLGNALIEIEEINEIIESIRLASAELYINDIVSAFPPSEDFDEEINNPVFESISTTSDFINAECDLSTYSNCLLLIFSNLQDFRSAWNSDSVPQAKLNNKVDIISVLFDCRYKAECEVRLTNWNNHFAYFNAKSFSPLLNKNRNQVEQNQMLGQNLVKAIQNIYIP